MTELSDLREEETLLTRWIELAAETKIVTPEGTILDLTLDTSDIQVRRGKVREDIREAVKAKKAQQEFDRNYDWYSNH